MLDPVAKIVALPLCNTRRLMREVRPDVPVDQQNIPLVERRLQFRLGFKAITRVEQSRKVRVNRFQRTKITVQELPDHFAKPGIVLRESSRVYAHAAGANHVVQKIEL